LILILPSARLFDVVANPADFSDSSPEWPDTREFLGVYVSEIYCRALEGIARFVDNEAETSVLIKERQPIASRVLIESTLAENRNLSLAHPNRNEGGLDIEPTSDILFSIRARIPGGWDGSRSE
jgi:hypothetical protein